MTRQQTEKMKAYEEKGERIGIPDPQRVRGEIDAAPGAYHAPGGCLASAAMSVRESVNTFIAVSRLSVEEK